MHRRLGAPALRIKVCTRAPMQFLLRFVMLSGKDLLYATQKRTT